MPQIVRVTIEAGSRLREIELPFSADRVVITFDDEREVIVSPTGVSSDGVQIASLGGPGGNSVSAADNGSIVQNVHSGGDSYVAARDQNLNFRH